MAGYTGATGATGQINNAQTTTESSCFGTRGEDACTVQVCIH